MTICKSSSLGKSPTHLMDGSVGVGGRKWNERGASGLIRCRCVAIVGLFTALIARGSSDGRVVMHKQVGVCRQLHR